MLDYYLKSDKYKADYDKFIDAVQEESYEEAWTNYEIGTSGEEGVSNFHIPPLVTWYDEDAVDNPDGTFTLTNVPVGHPYATYTIYQSECSGSGSACAANELPGSFTRVSRYITFQVTEDQAGETINLEELFP